MPSPFVSVTTVALDDIIRKHATASKFGFFLTEDQMSQLVGELVSFLETSRNLKAAGDRILLDSMKKPQAKKETKAQSPYSR